MVDLPHSNGHFLGNPFPAEDHNMRIPPPGDMVPAAEAPRDANVYPVPHHPRPPSLPHWHRHPIPIQPRGDAGALQNVAFPPVNAAGNGELDNLWGDIPLPAENIAARGRPQGIVYNDMDYYDAPHYPPPPPADLAVPQVHHPAINYNARIPQGVPPQAQVIAPPAPEAEIFDYAGQNAAAGPAQAFLDEWPQMPVFNEPAREALRRLANRYLNEPDSQVDVVRMERGHAGGIRVVITLDLVDLL